MNNAAAIQAQLVDIRNLGTEKCVKLTLHIPAEQAPLVLKAFGWPTAVDPVPVALARLTQPKENEAQPRPPVTESPSATTGGAQSKKSWHDMSPAQQAGILCNDPAFHKFLNECADCDKPVADRDDAARAVRQICGVQSRKEIRCNNSPGTIWGNIVADYRFWMKEPEVVGG